MQARQTKQTRLRRERCQVYLTRGQEEVFFCFPPQDLQLLGLLAACIGLGECQKGCRGSGGEREENKVGEDSQRSEESGDWGLLIGSKTAQVQGYQPLPSQTIDKPMGQGTQVRGEPNRTQHHALGARAVLGSLYASQNVEKPYLGTRAARMPLHPKQMKKELSRQNKSAVRAPLCQTQFTCNLGFQARATGVTLGSHCRSQRGQD